MKINHEIKNYIHKMLKAKASKKMTELDAKYDKANDEFEKKISKVREDISKEYRLIFEKYAKKLGVETNFGHWSGFDSWDVKTWMKNPAQKYADERSDFNNKINDEVEKIIVALSLGGDMKSLEEMIANVKF